jgi:TonB-linked SusC/RagA family outer membrane protein
MNKNSENFLQGCAGLKFAAMLVRRLTVFAACLCVAVPSLTAQDGAGKTADSEYVVEGMVYDEAGDPFEGVTIYNKDRLNMGTLTDSKGHFSIKVTRGSTLVFSFTGYTRVEYLVAGEKKDIEIHLAVETEEMEEVLVVGLGGTQRKISSVGAISTVDPKDLQVPTPSITNLLGGRVPGVITLQGSGEPGKNLAEFWVRGIGTFGANASALVLIDGLEGNLNDIDPADVESFSVLKDASATAVYGVRGANGVVLVTTKRGKEGKLNITARVNFSLSHLVRVPEYLSGYDYALLVNEARELRNEDPLYDEIELRVIKGNLDPDLYPNVNWQNEILHKNSFKQTYFASLSGGSPLAKYYASLGMSDETGAYKVEKGNPYASNAGYKTYSFRMNLNVNLTKTTELYFGSDMFMSVNNLPGQVNTDYIWQAQSRLTPLLVPVRYSNGQLPTGSTAAYSYSPYVMINHTGKHAVTAYKALLTMSLNQNLSSITEGLRLRIQGAYNRDGNLTETRYTIPDLYRAEGRNNKGDLVTRKIVTERKVSYSHVIQGYRKFHLESTLTYERSFGKHRTSGLVYYYMSDQQSTSDMTSSSLIGHDLQQSQRYSEEISGTVEPHNLRLQQMTMTAREAKTGTVEPHNLRLQGYLSD